MYKGKDKIRVNEVNEVLYCLVRDPSIKPTRLEMKNMLDKDPKTWSMQYLRQIH